MSCECEIRARNYAHNRAQTPGLVTEVFWVPAAVWEDSDPSGWEVLVWSSQAERAMGSTRQIAGTRRFYTCTHKE